MSEANKAIFQQHLERIWNNKDAGSIERFIAPTYRGFDAEEVIAGIAGYKQHFTTLITAFPDLRITVQIILADDVRVGGRWVVEATHKGPLGDIPPTGKRVRLTGTAIVQIRDGQIVEEHANSDALGLLRQLEVGPGPLTLPPLFF